MFIKNLECEILQYSINHINKRRCNLKFANY